MNTITAKKAVQKKAYIERLEKVREERHIIGKPFYLRGTRGVAVLLIHGWSSAPYEMRALGEYLHDQGYSVYAPLLAGHGTVPEDLEDVQWQQWHADTQEAFAALREQYEVVYVGGMSMGGSLALRIAQTCPDIAGLILLGTPHRMRYERIGHYIAKGVMGFRPYKKKYYPTILGSEKCMSQLISYQRYPYSSALEALYAIKSSVRQLQKVSQPCMIIQSGADHLVSRHSMHYFQKHLGSRHIIRKMLPHAYHNFIADAQHEYVFADIAAFIDLYTSPTNR